MVEQVLSEIFRELELPEIEIIRHEVGEVSTLRIWQVLRHCVLSEQKVVANFPISWKKSAKEIYGEDTLCDYTTDVVWQKGNVAISYDYSSPYSGKPTVHVCGSEFAIDREFFRSAFEERKRKIPPPM
ncbi:MAG: hypothetical protein AAB701_02455 [Patescibacteria group bacterium]